MTTPSPVYLVGIKLVGSGTLDFMLFHNRVIFSEKGVAMHWTGIYSELLCVKNIVFFNCQYRGVINLLIKMYIKFLYMSFSLIFLINIVPGYDFIYKLCIYGKPKKEKYFVFFIAVTECNRHFSV